MNSIRCRQCKHYIEANVGEGKIYGCDRSKCVFEPTTKNDLAGDIMDFPNTFDEFAKDYGFKDKDEVYTNGSELIPVFRVKQWLEHISTTKNDLAVDCISRADAIKAMQDKAKKLKNEDTINGLCGAVAILYEMPSVIPYMPSVNPQLSVPEVTALAEWTEKLTKECEEAYNKGYADGVKSVNICPHCGEYIGEEE